jgi:hypothetical protein
LSSASARARRRQEQPRQIAIAAARRPGHGHRVEPAVGEEPRQQLVVAPGLVAATDPLEVGRELGPRVAALGAIAQPAEILRSPAVGARHLARQREAVIDRHADRAVAAQAGAVLLVGLQPQPPLGVLDEALVLPAEAVQEPGRRVALVARRAPLAGFSSATSA